MGGSKKSLAVDFGVINADNVEQVRCQFHPRHLTN